MQLRMLYIPDETATGEPTAGGEPAGTGEPATGEPAGDETRPSPVAGRYSQRGCRGPCWEPCGG